MYPVMNYETNTLNQFQYCRCKRKLFRQTLHNRVISLKFDVLLIPCCLLYYANPYPYWFSNENIIISIHLLTEYYRRRYILKNQSSIASSFLTSRVSTLTQTDQRSKISKRKSMFIHLGLVHTSEVFHWISIQLHPPNSKISMEFFKSFTHKADILHRIF